VVLFLCLSVLKPMMAHLSCKGVGRNAIQSAGTKVEFLVERGQGPILGWSRFGCPDWNGAKLGKSGDDNAIGSLGTTKVSGVNRVCWLACSACVLTVELSCADMFVRSRFDAGTGTVRQTVRTHRWVYVENNRLFPMITNLLRSALSHQPLPVTSNSEVVELANFG
jgi:hypothetical protein